MPLISVLMPVYNCAATVCSAAESILRQNVTDLELIVVDDGSTDDSPRELKLLAQKDSRVRVIHQANGGVGAALNTAINAAQGSFFARMDSDDLSLPGRFDKQLAFLRRHPDIAVVGAMHETFGDRIESGVVSNFPVDDQCVKATLIWRCCVSHPTVLMRGELFRQAKLRYRERKCYPEDYHLWVDVIQAGYRIANLPDVMLKYRLWGGQTTASHEMDIAMEHLQVQQRMLEPLKLAPVDSPQWQLHQALAFDRLVATEAFIRDAHAWLLRIAEANERAHWFEHDALLRVLTGRYVALVRFSARQVPGVYDGLMASPLRARVEIALPKPA